MASATIERTDTDTVSIDDTQQTPESLEQEAAEARIQELLKLYQDRLMFKSTGATPDMPNRKALLEILEGMETSLSYGHMMAKDINPDSREIEQD